MDFDLRFLKQNKIYNIVNLIFCLSIFFWSIRYNSFQLKYLILILIIPTVYYNYKNFRNYLGYFSFFIILLFHSYFQLEFISTYSFVSIFFLFLILLIFDYYSNYFFKNFKKIIFLFCLILFIYYFVLYLKFGNLKVTEFNCIDCNYILFYKENSHLAVTILPVIYYLLNFKFFNNYIKIFFIISLLIICYFNPSITLFVGFVLIFFLSLIFNQFKLYDKKIIFLILLLLILIQQNYKRINNITNIFIPNSLLLIDNDVVVSLSADVYKNSLFVAKNSLVKKPLGYGFNNYHVAFEEFTNQNKNIVHSETKLLNKKDASNNFAKIITEFGIFSVFFFYFIVVFSLNKKIDIKTKILFLLPIIIQLSVRGVGYFNGGFIFYLMFIYIYSKNSSIIRNDI